MEISLFRKEFAHFPDLGLFFLSTEPPSTLEIDSLPPTGFMVLGHTSAPSHGLTTLDDAGCGLPLAAACC